MNLVQAVVVGYLIGSLPIGYLVAQVARGVDLRRVGSGNVGATNVYRTAGRGVAVVVMMADIGKGATSVIVISPGASAVAAGVAAIVGHVYPVWLGFRGGKGVATASGVFAILAPMATLIAAVVFVATVWRTRLVSLASIIATLALPIAGWLSPGPRIVDVAATAIAALILFRHRGNMARLWTHTERALGA